MSIILFEQRDKEHIYRVVYTNGHQYRISEHGISYKTSKSYHINRKLFEEIIIAREADRLNVAKDIYHAARLKKKGRVNAPRQEEKFNGKISN